MTPVRAVLPPLAEPVRRAVVVPALDAADTLPACLARVLTELDADDEVVVAAGDAASAAAARAIDDPRLRVVDNPRGSTPVALNLAIAATTAEVVVRVDSHALLPAGYVDRVTELLRTSGAANVGGRQVPSAERGFGAAVARAMSSRIGSGGAAYRHAGAVREVDTVYLGAFRRSALDAVGGYDERFVRNQDAELNLRLRRAGHAVLLDPTLEVGYRPRTSVGGLWRQYLGYGRWRRATARAHPGALSPRQLAAPALVVGLAAALVLGAIGLAGVPLVLGPLGPVGPAVPVALVAGGYGALVLLGAAVASRDRPGTTPAVALALVTMHLAWGVGFLLGPPRDR
jgi:succinoglycan biosynthesis protein ExoA